MADFTALKTAIQNAIKQNGNEEITGNLLQEVLLAIVTTLGDGSINELITALGTEATTRGNADTTLQQNINAEATTRGNADTALGGRIDGVVSSIEAINDAIENGYVYAGIATPSSTPASGKVFYLALTAGTYTDFGNIAVTQGINILKYNGSAWSLDAFAGIDDTPTQGSNNLVKSGGVLDSIIKDGSAFDLSAYNGGATYADLNAALIALNALPAAYKRGGMSMKFVLSSDNNYIQYRCISNEFTTDVTKWAINEEGVYVESDEFVYTKTDKDGRISIGIRKDGSIYFGAGCPPQVVKYITDALSNIITLIENKVDKVDGKSLIDSIYADCHNTIEDDDWASVVTDLANHIIEGYKKTGKKVVFVDTYHKGKLGIQGIELSIVPSEEWTEVKTDANGRICSYRDAEGKLHELVGVVSPNSNSLQSIKELPIESYGSNCDKHSLTKNDSSKLLTLKDLTTSKSGWLTSVKFYSNGSGTKTIYIGYIDQRSWAITRKSFKVNASSGINEIDVSGQHIMIDTGEVLFIEASNISYGELSQSESYPQMLYGPKDGALVIDGSTYGASLLFKWDVMPIESLYPFVEDFNNLQATVSELNLLLLETAVNENIIFDDNGDPYKLTVDNGEVVPVLQRFKKILVLGNSITEHDISSGAETRWLAEGRGMAATTPNNDFVHYLDAGFKDYDNTAEVVRHWAVSWERNLPTDPAVLAGYLTGYGTGYDLIIFTCCANITSTDSNQIYESTKAFMQVIQQTWPTAKLVVTSNFAHMWQSVVTYDYRELAMLKATSELNIPYINVGLNEFDSFIANFTTGAWVPMFAEGSDTYEGTIFPIQSRCATHPSDIGMYKIAKNILNALYYSLSDSIHNITCTCSQQHYAPSYWVEEGLVTIFCYQSIPSSIICKDANNNDVPTTIKDMAQESLYVTPSPNPVAAVVFTMPSTDVTIIIS